ncbi:Uncharacterised protein [Legionella wadsworthii]|uniref:Uncharacterized protein n=1 Tax=Legionella wadsworthii TaxID=28088 RepID=A0A378LT32_9GAMM|nr:Uncharacterised protein [Legionella wadsworthii]
MTNLNRRRHMNLLIQARRQKLFSITKNVGNAK